MTIRGKRFKDRILFSAHSHPQSRCDHVVTEDGIAYYAARAKGGAAQVTLGETPVDSVHAYRGTLEEHLLLNVPMTSGYMTRMSKLPNVIHSCGSLVSVQLAHAGEAAVDPIGPTGFVRPDGVTVKEMDEGDMQQVIEAFCDSARMARNLGFDGVQIHGGHGWLLAQFTSPLFNKRTDEYGGSLENRLRFPIRLLKAVREAIGENMLIEYRISGEELIEGGCRIEDTQEICRGLEPYVDLFQVSVGVYMAKAGNRMFPSIYNEHCCNAHLSAAVKQAVKTPVIAVGAILTPEEAEEMIASGKADFVASARGLMADPELPRKARAGRGDEVIPCVRCYGCMAGEFGPPFAVSCSVNPYVGKEQWLPIRTPRAEEPKRIVVIGGGPGGMTVAITAVQAGHSVILYERREKLGGALDFTDVDVYKHDLKRFKDYLIRMTEKCGADIRLNTAATPELVKNDAPDVIIGAFGAHARPLTLPGAEYARHAGGCYEAPDTIGHRVVMIGGGLIGCETGLHLAKTGHEVTIIETMDAMARDGYLLHVDNMLLEMKKQNVAVMTQTQCLKIYRDGVDIRTAAGGQEHIACDTVLYAVGMVPESDQLKRFEDCADMVIPIGDCVKPGKIKEAVHTGYFTVCGL